ncbi:hypothetical protein ABZV34_39580, partial [Streptomyces sp. NPDC005195]|uniref:hypothetical protein n=1 Tax=Streptomyces sp. NPDC005195 TaxID=3154561 RepID=UPI0033AC3B97
MAPMPVGPCMVMTGYRARSKDRSDASNRLQSKVVLVAGGTSGMPCAIQVQAVRTAASARLRR